MRAMRRDNRPSGQAARAWRRALIGHDASGVESGDAASSMAAPSAERSADVTALSGLMHGVEERLAEQQTRQEALEARLQALESRLQILERAPAVPASPPVVPASAAPVVPASVTPVVPASAAPVVPASAAPVPAPIPEGVAAVPRVSGGLPGATMADVIECWQAMRDRFGEVTPNKVKARQSLIVWMERQKNVSSESVLWFGDFVAIRSCPDRAKPGEPWHGQEGWWVLFDPNSNGYRSASLFSEAFASSRELSRSGPIGMELVRPAWISEATRLAEARRTGNEQARPFAGRAIEQLTEGMFVRGEAR